MKGTLLFKLLALLLLSGCNPDELETTTTLEGTVYDYVTKKPFPGVLVKLSGKETYAQGQANYYSDTCTTDSLGKYKLSVNTPSNALMVGYINVPGYFVWQTEVIADPELLPGRNYKREITLYKKNAYLEFEVTNSKTSTTYFDSSFWSDAFQSKGIYIPDNIKSGETYTKGYDVAGNANVYITWDFEKFNPSLGEYPNLDSIIVHPGDTAVYEIKL